MSFEFPFQSPIFLKITEGDNNFDYSGSFIDVFEKEVQLTIDQKKKVGKLFNFFSRISSLDQDLSCNKSKSRYDDTQFRCENNLDIFLNKDVMTISNRKGDISVSFSRKGEGYFRKSIYEAQAGLRNIKLLLFHRSCTAE